MATPRSTLLLVTAIGFVVAAGAAAILLVTGVVEIGDDDGVDTRDVDLPDQLNGLVTVEEAAGESGGSDRADTFEQQDEATAEALRDAYGGPSVDVQTYASDDLETMVSVIAIRAESPELVPPIVVSPGDLELEVPPVDVETVGNVECLVRNPPTPEGNEVDVEQIVVELCQRTDDDLTVRAIGRTRMTADEMAEFVDAAWEAITS
jgi:hypothetical protein